MPPQNREACGPEIAMLKVLISAMDEKFMLLLAEAEKRNGQRFDAQQEAAKAAMDYAEKAVIKAETAAEKRFESVNEFRKTLSDQTASFITRNEYSVQHQALADRVSVVEKKVEITVARGSGRHDVWLILTTVIAIMIALGSLFIHIKSG